MILSDKDLKSVLWVPSKRPLLLSAKRCMSHQNADQSWEWKTIEDYQFTKGRYRKAVQAKVGD